MTIIEVLRDDTINVRLSYGHKWLYWNGEWNVESRAPYERKNHVLYRGDSEQDAVEALVNGG